MIVKVKKKSFRDAIMIVSKRSKDPPNVKPSPKRHLRKLRCLFNCDVAIDGGCSSRRTKASEVQQDGK